MQNQLAIQLKNVTKTFGSVVANSHVDLDVYQNEILAILGENGSGKTTLMNMIAGIYFPDEGQISIDGKEVVIRSPKDAFANRIGMIHQHFKLVDVFSAADNILLGEELPKFGFKERATAIWASADTAATAADQAAKSDDSATAEDAAATAEDTATAEDGATSVDNAAPTAGQTADDSNAEEKREKGAKSKFEAALKIASLPLKMLLRRIKFNHLARKRAASIQNLVTKYGFDIDLKKKIYDMSVSEKQTVEIIKVLYRNADILILDEPTAVLTPQEIDKLFSVLRNMRADGKSIIIITHKLNEVMAISDRVAVLRKGKHIATVNTAETSESALTEMMVGKKILLNINRTEPKDVCDRLICTGLGCKNRDGIRTLTDVSFTARAGEILGIAGIAGSGQRELLEAVAGLQKLEGGSIVYNDPTTGKEVDLRSKTPIQIRDLGVRLSFVPEDRLGMGLVGNMDIIDNIMLRSYGKGKSIFLDRKSPKELAEHIVSDLEVVTPSTHVPVRRLSGGNVQKVLVGREISSAPTVLMAAYPVRGLDINSSYTIYNLLNEQKENGVAVIFVGEDLDVLIELCDRIMVVCNGRVSGIVDGRSANKEELGKMMTSTAATDNQTDTTGDK